MITEDELRALSDEELTSLRAAVDTETSRRALLDNAEAMLRDLNQRVLKACGTKSGDDWKQPSGAFNAYSKGWIVKHKGKLWESLINGNVHEPGVSGWREVVAAGSPPALWVQPAGGHDAYSFNDKVQWPLGTVWRNNIKGTRNNVWEPGVHGWVRE